MNRRELLLGGAALVGLAGCAQRAPSSVRAAGARFGEPQSLPPPVLDGPLTLERAIAARRSVREYRPDPLPIATIGQLLWAAQGVTSSDGKRAAPSAGAIYPLDIYVVTVSQVIHYLPDGHRIQTRAVADLRPRLRDAAFGQEPVATAPAIVVVAARANRTRAKYGARAATYIALEAGHAAQNMLLVAVAHGLSAVPIGSISSAECASVLALPPESLVYYLIPVGRRA